MNKLIRSWNSFIRSLIQTKDAWERFRGLMEDRPNLDSIEPMAQKYMSLPFNRSTFFKAIPEFIRIFGNSRCDLRELLIKEVSETKKEVPHGTGREARPTV